MNWSPTTFDREAGPRPLVRTANLKTSYPTSFVPRTRSIPREFYRNGALSPRSRHRASHRTFEQDKRFQAIDRLVAAVELPQHECDRAHQSVRNIHALRRTMKRMDRDAKRRARRPSLWTVPSPGV